MRISTLVLAATIAAVSLPALSTSASAYACKAGSVGTQAIESTRIKSKIQARKNWRNHIKNTQGLEWSVWKIAKSRSVTCQKQTVNNTWNCIAKAKPCRYVVQ